MVIKVEAHLGTISISDWWNEVSSVLGLGWVASLCVHVKSWNEHRQQKVAKHNKITLTRITLSAKWTCHMYNLELVSCSFLLSRKLLSNHFYLSSSMHLQWYASFHPYTEWQQTLENMPCKIPFQALLCYPIPGTNFMELLKQKTCLSTKTPCLFYTCYWPKFHAIYIAFDWYLALVYLA